MYIESGRIINWNDSGGVKAKAANAGGLVNTLFIWQSLH
jgi:hypothetical protein